jgi:hypothetical protein
MSNSALCEMTRIVTDAPKLHAIYVHIGVAPACRRGDAAQVGPQHVHNNTISIATEKSQGNTVVHLPLLDALKRTLAASPAGSESFICKVDVTPYAKSG